MALRSRPGLTCLPALAFAVAAGQGVPAAAANFAVPSGCAARMTVQMRGCVVGQYFSCHADGAGMQRTVLFDSDGPFFATLVDAEYQWIESTDLPSGVQSWLEQPSQDAASFSHLLASGQDSYDFTTMSSDGQRQRYIGEDRLAGESVTIDGVALERTEFRLEERDEAGRIVSRRSGRQFVHGDWRLFFSGPEVVEDATGEARFDNSPVQFVFPGEPGYLSTVPLFDCDSLMSHRQPVPNGGPRHG